MTKIQVQKLVDYIILDIGGTDEIGEPEIKKFIAKAIGRLNRILKSAGTSIIISQANDDCDIEINDAYVVVVSDLIVLQVECMVSKRRYYDAVSKGIKIKSGSDSVDTTSSFGGYDKLSSETCNVLKDAIKDFINQLSSDAVVEGGDVIWYGDQREFWEGEDIDNSRKNFKSSFDTGKEWD